MTDEQDKWLETLTGHQHDDDGQDSPDTLDTQDASCLRRALLKLNEDAANDAGAGDQDRQVTRLVNTLKQEGLLNDETKSHSMGFRYAMAAMFVVALVAPLVFLVNEPSEIDHVESAKIESSNVGNIEQLQLAREMKDYGVDNKDASALIVAMNIYKGVSLDAFASTQVAEPSSSSLLSSLVSRDYAEFVYQQQAELVPQARDFAQGDVVLLAMIDDVDAQTLRGAGGKVYVGETGDDQTSEHELRFSGGELAAVYIEGVDSLSGDLDLFIYDEDGELVCADIGTADAGLCQWTPEHDAIFRLKIDNTGQQKREYVVLTN